jgi:hypothetical protein
MLNKMIRYLKHILLVLILIQGTLFAQNMGNEWIDLSQQYYRFGIAESGVYKITNTQLQSAGIPISNFSPQNIQLFQNGVEIPCYIKGESQGLIEYILFYAEKNSGWFDIEMYDDPIHQSNPNYSLINDEATVFLTWNTSFSNKRFAAEKDINFTGYTPETYCWEEAYAEYTNTYYAGLEDCEYVEGEGWFDNKILEKGQKVVKSISTPDFKNAGVNSRIELAFVSLSKSIWGNENKHHINVTAPSFELDTIFKEYRSIKISQNLVLTSLDTSTSITFESIDDQGAISSKVAASFIKLSYTRGFSCKGESSFEFELPASPSAKSYIEISGFNASGNPYLFDITNNKIIDVVYEDKLHKALVPSFSSKLKLILINETSFKSLNSIEKAAMVNHANKDKNYVIISHPYLWQSAQEYASYRNAYLVDIEGLYDQFAYGIKKHPLAIRNFLKYINQTWDELPEHLFLIGKAVESHQVRSNEDAYSNCLVPTMGQYGSDVLLSNRILGNGYESAIPTGRLAASSNNDVEIYLNKVKEFESNAADEWMKRGIHFGGGINATEQESFKTYLNNYENVFTDTLFGGTVSTFLKTSSDPIVISKSDSIKNLINKGVSLMTFFGHGSAASGFDQNIDEPIAYNNSGKYPLIIANSCYTGNIHLNGKASKSEDWILLADKGAIGFLAVVGSGYATTLNTFSQSFYNNISLLHYGKTIGQNIKESQINTWDISNNNDRIKKFTIHEFTLHGDPGIILNSFPLPDLKVNNSDVSFSPKIITTDIDSFYIQIVATNQSRTTNQIFTLEFDRYFSGLTTNHFTEIQGLKYKDTIRFKLPVDKINGLGNNRFVIRIDASNVVDELNETNNTVEVNTFISSSDLVPVVPYKYSFERMDNFVLKASSIDAFASEQISIFEIDTSYLFNSPFLVSENMLHTGGIIEWIPSVSAQQGKTYYWRIAKNSEDKKWSQSSFCADMVKEGWHQSNYGQLRDNSLRFIESNDARQIFEFTKAPKTLIVKNIGTPTSETEFRSIAFGIDGVGAGSSCGPANAMIVAVIDSLTLLPWKSDLKGTIGHVNYPQCSNKTYPENYFIFQSDNIDNIVKLVEFVENDVPDGHYVLIYSFRNGNYNNYNEFIRSSFQSWGADNIRFINNNIPYIFFFKKGYQETAEEVIGASTTTDIDLYKELKSNFTYGTMESPVIGPAKSWDQFNWDWQAQETNSEEIAFVKVFGIDNSNKKVLLLDSVSSNSNDLSSIQTNTYPYLKLVFHTRDELFRTPAKLNSWEVLFESVTDLAINPQKGYEFYSDTLNEGEQGSLTISIENIGTSATDSTLVNYWIQNSSNDVFPVLSKKLRPLAAGEATTDTVAFETRYKKGDHTFWMEINPANTGQKAPSIKEQYYFNNLAQKPFYIKEDQTNPMLDVTFDGMHIMDGDLVSASPEIVIQLKDENQYILLNDTSVFSFYLKSQTTGIEQKINISSNPEVVFIPGQMPKNKAQIIYTPTFSNNGIYELRVQAKDQSGNESGAFDYLISFQVITESTISNVFNYPNPFSTSTRFVFELTGSKIPYAFSIEILTITGKVVKVIYLEDLGHVQIGRNITEYAWNGTDMYNDPLANGVYFYRVNARINGKEIKIRDTGTNQYFKKGFGKMYIMR